MDIGPFVTVAITIALMAEFWPHCARPCLVAAGARPLAFRIVFAVTVLSIAGELTYALMEITDTGGSVAWWLSIGLAVLWVVVVGIGYWTGFKTLIQATGGADPLAALRSELWGLGYALDQIARGTADRRWTKRARHAVGALPALRTPETATLIDLWTEEAGGILDSMTSDRSPSQRHEAIRVEAHRLWPGNDDWKVAALVRG